MLKTVPINELAIPASSASLESGFVKKLMLSAMRHAKSSWDFPDLDDHDRPLNKRGVNSAKLICEFFIKKKLKFDLVYCSSSKRTIQTLNILSEKISFKKIIKKKALYHASEDEIIHILKQTVDNYKTLLLINHEPSISELINRICLKENSDQFENLKRKFPTAAVAEVSFNFNDWKKLSKVKGKLISFIKPKDLQASKE